MSDKKKNKSINKNNPPKKASEQIFLKTSFSKMGAAIKNEIYQSVSYAVV